MSPTPEQLPRLDLSRMGPEEKATQIIQIIEEADWGLIFSLLGLAVEVGQKEGDRRRIVTVHPLIRQWSEKVVLAGPGLQCRYRVEGERSSNRIDIDWAGKVGRRTYEALNMRETTNLANLFQRLNRLPSDYAGLAIWCDFNQLKTALEELASNPRPGDSILTALLTGLCRASGQPYQK